MNNFYHRTTTSSTQFVKNPFIRHNNNRNSINNKKNNNASYMIRFIQILFVFILMIGLIGSISSWYYIAFMTSSTISKTTSNTKKTQSRINNNDNTDIDDIVMKKLTEYILQPKIINNLYKIISNIRKDYDYRYGIISEQLYNNGIIQYGNTMNSTSYRFLYTTFIQRKDFVLSFAGYSVTVGRGNYYNQSYPFVIQRTLQPFFQQLYNDINTIPITDSTITTKNPSLIVRNSAIGGIPSFPYGFCFQHFLGDDSNVISWDYSMNENGKDSSVLESYIRQSYNQLYKTKPMLIVLDTNQYRCKLIQQYITKQYIHDAICVGTGKDILKGTIYNDPNKFVKDDEDDKPPPGIQNWNDFGAPPNCPGRSSWHPKKQEHELIGWIISIYFLNAIDNALHYIQNNPNNWWKTPNKINDNKEGTNNNNDNHMNHNTKSIIQFPIPLSSTSTSSTTNSNSDVIKHLLYGHPDETNNNNNKNGLLTMHDVSCRTNFLPATNNDKVLSSIIISGLSPNANVDDIIEKRTDDMYHKGWVYDISDVERDTKIKVNQCGGLGYIDMKIALYGISKSSILRLFIPYESSSKNNKSSKLNDNNMLANTYFNNLIICEANEKRKKEACQLDQHIQYTVGNVIVPTNTIQMINGAGEYLQRKTCLHIDIPLTSQTIYYKNIIDQTSPSSKQQERNLLLQNNNNNYNDNDIGMIVDIEIKSNDITRANGACCISHVVWEHTT